MRPLPPPPTFPARQRQRLLPSFVLSLSLLIFPPNMHDCVSHNPIVSVGPWWCLRSEWVGVPPEVPLLFPEVGDGTWVGRGTWWWHMTWTFSWKQDLLSRRRVWWSPKTGLQRRVVIVEGSDGNFILCRPSRSHANFFVKLYQLFRLAYALGFESEFLAWRGCRSHVVNSCYLKWSLWFGSLGISWTYEPCWFFYPPLSDLNQCLHFKRSQSSSYSHEHSSSRPIVGS